jgi:hypothetical protein
MNKLLRELKIYRLCPEIRGNMRRLYLSKAMSIATVVLLSPILLISLTSAMIVHVFDYVGQYTVWPAHKLAEWLHGYQRDQIREAHAILDIPTIQKRIGEHDEDL